MQINYQSNQSGIRLFLLIVRDLLFVVVLIGIFMLISDLVNHLTSRIFITDKGVFTKKGIFNSSTKEVIFSNINSVTINQNVWGRLLNYGDLLINTGGDEPEIVFEALNRPYDFKEKINQKLTTKTN